MTTKRAIRRSGAVMLETALVLPVLFIFLMGIIVGGYGVFRSQLVACQAREAARWAAVRGGDYQRDENLESPTAQGIADQAVVPLAAGMDPAALAVTVQWVDKATNAAQDWDASPKEVRSITADGKYVTNAVRVTVSYQWSPGVLSDPILLQSTCELPMAR